MFHLHDGEYSGGCSQLIILDTMLYNVHFVHMEHSHWLFYIPQEMWSIFESLASEDFSSDECFVLVILTHGKTGVVYGTDECTLPISHIVKLFCRVHSLQKKPKIFLLNSCQGGKL